MKTVKCLDAYVHIFFILFLFIGDIKQRTLLNRLDIHLLFCFKRICEIIFCKGDNVTYSIIQCTKMYG